MFKEAIKTLETHGVHPSVQRISIMKYLLEHKTHPNVDEIYNALSTEMPTLSRTTVYNTLKLLVSHGAAQALTIDEKNNCFDADTSPHAHFLCHRCGKIYDMRLQEESERNMASRMDGFLVEEIHHYYKGICKDCQKQSTNRTRN